MARLALQRQQSAFDKMVLIDSGWSLIFDSFGRYYGEEAFSPLKRYASMRKVDVVSVLATDTSVELAFSIGDSLHKKETDLNLFQIGKIIETLGTTVFTCYREVQGENGAYAQYIYLYNEGAVNMNAFQ